MKDLGQMFKQAQELQSKMAAMQQRLEGMEIVGVAGGEMVKVTLNGKGEMCRLSIDPELLRAPDVEVLEDLIVAAHNDAKGRVERQMAEEMSKLTGGMPLPPGFKLPM